MPEVVPFEGPEVLLIRLRLLPLEQVDQPPAVAGFQGLLGQVQVGPIPRQPGQPLALLGTFALVVCLTLLLLGPIALDLRSPQSLPQLNREYT
jgi:hypothetical protein